MDSRTPMFLVEKRRFLRGLGEKRIIIYGVIIIVEKNPVDIMLRVNIYC
jgi:hypothetical protein